MPMSPAARLLIACLVPSLLAFQCRTPVASEEEGDDPTRCSDEVDNDNDGLTDCADESCQQWSVCGGDTGDTEDTSDTDTDEPADSEMCINEFMASNSMTLPDETGAYPDWIEVHNKGDADVDIGGYTITDDLEDKEKYILADGLVLPAGGYLLLYADGDAGEEGQNDQHLSFKLSKGGEQIGLYDPDGKAQDKVEYQAQATDQSAARMPDCERNSWQIDSTPTPGETNE